MFPSYRNLSVALQSKRTDWFLYDGNIGCQKVKFWLTFHFNLFSDIAKYYHLAFIFPLPDNTEDNI